MPIYGNPVGGNTGIPSQAKNADTVDGKHADEFATTSDTEQLQTDIEDLQTDMSQLQTQVGDTSVSEQIEAAITAKVAPYVTDDGVLVFLGD